MARPKSIVIFVYCVPSLLSDSKSPKVPMRCDVRRASLATAFSQRALFPLLRPARRGLVMRDVLVRAGGCAVHDAPAGAAVLHSCRAEKGSRKRHAIDSCAYLRVCIAGPTDGKCHPVRCAVPFFIPCPISPSLFPSFLRTTSQQQRR